ncbi:MAG: hypothetical protein ABEJ07_02005 [Candidatus Nanohaloarchaea archaeon]
MADKNKTVSFRMEESDFDDFTDQLDKDDISASAWGRDSAAAYVRNPEAYNFVISLLAGRDIDVSDIAGEEDVISDEVEYLQDFRLAVNEVDRYGKRGDTTAVDEIVDAFEDSHGYEPVLENFAQRYR